MEEMSARASLGSSSAVIEGGLSTTLAREDVEDALRMDEPADLVLDVTRYADGGPAETKQVAITWEREDLARLLRESAGDRITLTFDRETLWQALEGVDVEGHGLREKVVVFAVVAGMAAGGATAAAAAPDPGGGTTATPVVAEYTGPSSSILEGSDVAKETPTYGPSSSILEGSVIAPDNRADRSVAPTDTGVVAPDDRADRFVPTTGPTPGVVAPDDRADRSVVPTDSGVVAPDDRAVRTVTPTPAPVQADDGGLALEAPSPAEVAGIAGAIALAITGAAFVARSRRPAQPA
jgi:hypothetical protein